MQAVIDGRIKNTMCMKKWHAQKHRLTPLNPSKVTLSVTHNHHIPSEGRWTGIVDVAGTKAIQSFEVFNSHGAFQIILGKLWLSHIQAVHRYNTDQITFQTQGLEMTINNDNATQDGGHAPEQKDKPEPSTDKTRQTQKQETRQEEEADRQEERKKTLAHTKEKGVKEQGENATDA